MCTEYGTAQYCSGTPECVGAVKATSLVAVGLLSGAHAYKDGGVQGAGVFGDRTFHDALHSISDKVQATVREHRQQQSLLQVNAKGPALCARLAYLQAMQGFVCHINCNAYSDSQEVSVGCDIPVVPNLLAINIELHITWGPVFKLTVNAVIPGISDVLGEIQKIPACNEIMSAAGMNNGGMLLGVGYLDFPKGIGALSYSPNVVDLWAVRAKASFGVFLRFDLHKPTTLDPNIKYFCNIGWIRGTACGNPNDLTNCALCGVDNVNQYCGQCKTNPVKFVKFSVSVRAEHIEPRWGWPPYSYNEFWRLTILNLGQKY